MDGFSRAVHGFWRNQAGAGPRGLSPQLGPIEHHRHEPLARQGVSDRQADHTSTHDHNVMRL